MSHKNRSVKVLSIPLDGEPKVVMVPADLDALKDQLLGGRDVMAQHIVLAGKLGLLCDEDARMKNLKANRLLGPFPQPLLGPLVVVRWSAEGEFASVTPADVKQAKGMFRELH